MTNKNFSEHHWVAKIEFESSNIYIEFKKLRRFFGDIGKFADIGPAMWDLPLYIITKNNR
jgi:hypothetical protein